MHHMLHHGSAHEQLAAHSCTTAVVRPYCIFGYGKITDIGTFSFRWILPFWYFCFLLEDKVSLALSSKTSEREGKLSNPRARAARAMQGENLRKFTETRARSPRARYALILPRPKIQYHGMYYLYNCSIPSRVPVPRYYRIHSLQISCTSLELSKVQFTVYLTTRNLAHGARAAP
jgi:hypothetical protein